LAKEDEEKTAFIT
jgi:ribonuclease HI